MCFIIYNKAFFLLPLWPTLHIFMFVLTGLTVNINMTFLGWRQQIKPNKTHVAPKCPVSKGFSKVPSSCSYSGLLYNSLCVCVLSHVRLSAIPWTVAHKAPLFREFSRQYWSGLPFPSLRSLPNPGIKPLSSVFPALAGRFFTTSATWETY